LIKSDESSDSQSGSKSSESSLGISFEGDSPKRGPPSIKITVKPTKPESKSSSSSSSLPPIPRKVKAQPVTAEKPKPKAPTKVATRSTAPAKKKAPSAESSSSSSSKKSSKSSESFHEPSADTESSDTPSDHSLSSESSSDYDPKQTKKTSKKPVKKTPAARGKKVVSYADHSSTSSSSAEDEGTYKGYHTEPESDTIDIILGSKKTEDGTADMFFVKLRDRSYRSAKWMTEGEVLKLPQGGARIRKFFQKEQPPGPLFPADYAKVERVLCKDKTQRKGQTLYFVKWKSLPYESATWEDSEFLEEEYPHLIEALKKRSKVPSTESQDASLYHTSRSKKDFSLETPAPAFKEESLQLRSYQMEGFLWLTQCWCVQRNCILADEMGLGKTIQSLSMLQWLKAEHNIRGPFLVIAPMTCAGQWQSELEKWTDLNVVVYHGTQVSRDMIREYEFFWPNLKKKVYKFDVLITTYEILLKDISVFSKIYWKYAIIDEAHRVENPGSQLFKALKKFQMEQYVLLTGTPIQNNIAELWTMLHFLDPTKFPSSKAFVEEFGDLTKNKDVVELQKTLSRYLLRRMKEDIAKDIPAKEETIIQVELTILQHTYYRALYEKNRDLLFLNKKGSSKGPSLMNILIQQRKVCNHPFLLEDVEESVTQKMSQTEIDHIFVSCSSKLVLLDKILKNLLKDGHKVLVFSQMVKMLNLIARFCDLKGYTYERLDGGVNRQDRRCN